MANQVIANRYEILSKLGAGGVAVVYKVKDLSLKNLCALKTLKNQDPKPEQIVRFQKEASALSGLRHANIVSTLDFGIDQANRPYMVMDFVEGVTLKQFLKRNGPIQEEHAIPIIEQLCDALAYIHKKDVLHRDLKSSNIMVEGVSTLTKHDWQKDPNLDVKILDFGLVKNFEDSLTDGLTKPGQLVGTPLYMSPEQCDNRKLDKRSEIYSLGCVIFEILTGEVPLKGGTGIETIEMHRNKQAPTLSEGNEALDYSPELETIIAKCLAKDPEDRYQTMEELKEVIQNPQIEDHDVSTSYQYTDEEERIRPDDSKRNFYLIASSGLLFILFVVYLGFSLLRLPQPSKTSRQSSDLYYFDGSTADPNKLIRFQGDCGVMWKAFSTSIAIATDESIRGFNSTNCPDILCLCKQTKVTTEGLDIASKLPLVGIGLNDRNLTGLQLRLFTRPNNTLKILFLYNNKSLKDEDLAHLKNLHKLEYLYLGENVFTDESLKYIAQAPALKTLRLDEMRGNKFTGEGLKYLENCSQLKRLCLADNKLSDTGWQNLAKLKQLELLTISHTNLNGERLKLVASMNLKKLDVSETNVNTEDFECLRKMKSLKLLYLKSRKKQKPLLYDKIQKYLPGVTVKKRPKTHTQLVDALLLTENDYKDYNQENESE